LARVNVGWKTFLCEVRTLISMIWTCKFCTFENQSHSTSCKACSTSKASAKPNKFCPARGRFSLRKKPKKEAHDGIDYSRHYKNSKRKRAILESSATVKKEENDKTLAQGGTKRKRNQSQESKYVGITWDKTNNVWQAAAMIDNKSVFFGSNKSERNLAKSFRLQVKDLENEGHHLGDSNYGELKSKIRKKKKLKEGSNASEPEVKRRKNTRSHYEGRSLYCGVLFQTKPKPRFISNIRVNGRSKWIGQDRDQHELARLVRETCVQLVEEGAVLSNPSYGFRRDGRPLDHVLIARNSSDLNSTISNADNSSDEEDIADLTTDLVKFSSARAVHEIKLEYANPLVAVIEAHENDMKRRKALASVKSLLDELLDILPPAFGKYKNLLEENGFNDEVVWDVALQGESTQFLERLLKHNFHGQVLFKKMKQIRTERRKI